MAFALKHACRHGLGRVIYVAPFTSIIEQNADVFRKRLGEDALIEHHCNVDAEHESSAARLASENWDAPLIVTTAVQFYDSLFSNRPSTCRKLHNMARSVIIMDEAQSLPVEYLKPCLAALNELTAHYGSTVVLCTATQPAIRQRPDFDIGLKDVREIVSNPPTLYNRLKRVRIRDRGTMDDAELAAELMCRDRVLCIVNTTSHARALFDRLGAEEGHFHMSARMCPAHRAETLAAIRARLDEGRTCRVVSTQVVEAGVDLDFPSVFRSLAGLDSIAQAAGRCNRNGRFDDLGEVNIFRSEHIRSEAYFRETAQCAAQVMDIHADPLALDANEHFFRLYYWNRQAAWDKKRILDAFRLSQDIHMPFDFAFASVAREFHLIDEGAACSVIVPWGEEGEQLTARLRVMRHAPPRDLLRRLQRYMVRVRKSGWDRHVGHAMQPVFDTLGILESPETHYDGNTGLNLEAEGPGIYFG